MKWSTDWLRGDGVKYASLPGGQVGESSKTQLEIRKRKLIGIAMAVLLLAVAALGFGRG